jgi:hypothetical protein
MAMTLTRVMLVALAGSCLGAASALAGTCDDIGNNNPAFSSSPATPPCRKPTELLPTKPPAKPLAANAAPVTAALTPNQPLNNKPLGNTSVPVSPAGDSSNIIYNDGQTVIYMHGAVQVDVATGRNISR